MLSEAIVMRRSEPPVAEQAPVLRELQHRMANTLAILQANCRVEFASVSDPVLREGLRRHESRILRLAELHHFLSRGADRSEIKAADYFQSLCDVLRRSILGPLAIRCEFCAGEGVLDATTCEWLGLIVSELVMNAAKHAFPERTGGRIRVELYAPDGMAWCCTVSDNGCGMRKTTAAGAGSRIVDSLVRMLEGEMAIDSGAAGTAVTIRFPVPLPKSRATNF